MPSPHRINSSYEDLERFFNGTLWKDIKAVLEEGIEDGHEELEDITSTEKKHDFVRGKIDQIRRLANFDEHMLDYKKLQLEDEERERQQGDPGNA